MSTSVKSNLNDVFHFQKLTAGKNGRRRALISHDLALTLTWATPQKALFARRSNRYDA